MKKFWFFTLLMALLCVALIASAEETLLDLRGIETTDVEEVAALIDAAEGVTTVDLTDVPLALEDCALLRERYPDVRFLWTLTLYKTTVTADATKIDFGNARIRHLENLPQFLRCFPDLEEVLMYEATLPPEEREALCEEFPNILFGFTLRFQSNGYAVRTAEVTAFSTLKDGSPPYLQNNHLWWLPYCPYLKALDIGHNLIDDLSFLYDAPKLKVLILACNRVKDLTPLTSQPELEYLELFINRIEDVTPLAELKNIKDLNLSFNEGITDITPLYDFPNLERLWLSWDKGIPQEQIDKLYEIYPDAEIVTKSYGSTGVIYLEDGSSAPGWREHPHYPVIYHMFNHGEYVDWDWDFHTCKWCDIRFSPLFEK